MPGRTRKFSEGEDSRSISSSLSDAHSDGRSFLSYRPKKRLKTGLNARFSHMIDTMKTMSTSSSSLRPAITSPTIASSSHRRGSSKTSSVTDIADSFNGLDNERIGQEFSLIKMKHARSPAKCGEKESSPSCHKESLPPWLHTTISQLAIHHPLRVILPVDHHDSEMGPANDAFGDLQPVVDQVPTFAMESMEKEEPIFAFTVPPPPTLPARFSEPIVPKHTLHPFDLHLQPVSSARTMSLTSFLEQLAVEHHPTISDSPGLPFSTPGPIPRHPTLMLEHEISKTEPPIANYPLFNPTFQNNAASSITTASPPAPTFFANYTSRSKIFSSEDELFLQTAHKTNIETLPQPPIHVYFDSPLDDPSSSDPMEPSEYQIFKPDPEKLGFRWTPFNRKDFRSNTNFARVDYEMRNAEIDEFLEGAGMEEAAQREIGRLYDLDGAGFRDDNLRVDSPSGPHEIEEHSVAVELEPAFVPAHWQRTHTSSLQPMGEQVDTRDGDEGPPTPN